MTYTTISTPSSYLVIFPLPFHVKYLILFSSVTQLARQQPRRGSRSFDICSNLRNASRHKAMSYKRMIESEAALKAEIACLLEQVLPAMNFRRELVAANGGVNWWRG